MKKIILAIILTIITKGILMGATIETITIKDVNVPIVFQKDDQLPLFGFAITFKGSGSMNDKDKLGLANMSAALLNYGTKKLGNIKFAEKLESKAIQISAGSGFEAFSMHVSSLGSEYKQGLSLLKQLIDDPNYTQKALEKIKISTKASILKREDNFDYVASKNLKSILFKGTPLEHSSSGSLESIQDITLGDIKSFIKSNLILERAIISAGGNIDIKELKENIKPILEGLPRGDKVELKSYDVSSGRKDIQVKKQTQQAYIHFGAPFFIKDFKQEAYKAKVASFILGSGGFGSRMLEEIRVKQGLAYSAYMRLDANLRTSQAKGYLQTGLKNDKKAIKSVKAVLKEFVENGVSAKELKSAKDFILGSEPLKSETLSQRLSRAFSHYYQDLPLNWHEIELEKIKNLKLKELNDFIKSHKEILDLTFSVVIK